MPRPKYLTAEQLQITPKERVALLKVKTFLKRLPTPENYNSVHDHSAEKECVNEAPSLFCMNRSVARFDCGTGGCIGGWMHMSMSGIPLRKRVKLPAGLPTDTHNYVYARQGPLHKLFFPSTTCDYTDISPERAAQEINTFLTTGQATW